MAAGHLSLSVEMKDLIISAMTIACGPRVRAHMDSHSGPSRLFLYLSTRLLTSSSKFFTFPELTSFRTDFNMSCKVSATSRHCKPLKKAAIISATFSMSLASSTAVSSSFWTAPSVQPLASS